MRGVFYFIFISWFFFTAPFYLYSQQESFHSELDDLMKELINNYSISPTEENKVAIQNQISINYDKALIEKKEKLEELKRTTNDQIQINSLQNTVNEMIENRTTHINQTLEKYIDLGLKLKMSFSSDTNYLPIPGVSSNIAIAYTTVTNKKYLDFVKATSHPTPFHWTKGVYPEAFAEYPVIYVSYFDALAYCRWLTERDKTAIYRLPTEKEWELAAGFIPKNAEFNAGIYGGLTPVNYYSETKSVSGAIDMWGNVWEWTSTRRDNRTNVVKGGAWDSTKDQCQTNYKQESKTSTFKYNNVGFRIVRVK